MNENFKWIAAAVAGVALLVGAVVYRSQMGKRDAAAQKPVVVAPAQPAVPENPPIKHPLPDSPAPEPLPSLADSDVPVRSALAEIIGPESFEQFVNPKDLVRHFVVTVDNLPEPKVAERIRAFKPAPGRFSVSGSEESPVLDPANYERYKPLVQLMTSMDSERLISTYVRYYPLFQESYASLGHAPEYFNDRLIEVIDHLLVTPEVADPIALARPNVQFEFADPKLESLSAGQKALIRMGQANAVAVKDKLRELRIELVAQQPKN